ncbi:MAG: hypothetical protein LBG65_02555 [Puniceicoccales bacterium]|nr:hypothetical protein [Puniceicoccales bacterium]
MDALFLTGAGSEPAQSIASRLVAAGYRIYGFDSHFPAGGFAHTDFIPVLLNPASPRAVRAAADGVLAREGSHVIGVILAGNFPVEAPFEAAHPEDIATAVNAGLLAPLLLARAALPSLVRLRGALIAITRDTATSPGTLAAVQTGGLAAFTRALFEEVRDTGVRTAHMRLARNSAPPDPAARLTHTPQSEIQPGIVASTIEELLRMRENNALTELTLRPQATREEPRLPVTAEPRLRAIQVVRLPEPGGFPPEKPPIPTLQRRRPAYAPPPGQDEEPPADDDSDDSVDPELLYLIKPSAKSPAPDETPDVESATAAEDPSPPAPEGGAQPPARLQGGRGGQRPQRHAGQKVHAPSSNAGPAPAPPRPNPDRPGADPAPPEGPEAAAVDAVQSPARTDPRARPDHDAGTHSPAGAHSAYPENWHGPRPPNRFQRKRLEQRKRWLDWKAKKAPSADASTPLPSQKSGRNPHPDEIPGHLPNPDAEPPVPPHQPRPDATPKNTQDNAGRPGAHPRGIHGRHDFQAVTQVSKPAAPSHSQEPDATEVPEFRPPAPREYPRGEYPEFVPPTRTPPPESGQAGPDVLPGLLPDAASSANKGGTPQKRGRGRSAHTPGFSAKNTPPEATPPASVDPAPAPPDADAVPAAQSAPPFTASPAPARRRGRPSKPRP